MTRYQDPIDQRFQALADPTRRAIVERLVQGPAAVSALAAPFDMALPTVMQHLRILESSGLIQSEKRGRVRTCRVDPDALRGVEDWFGTQIQQWEKRLDALDALVTRMAKEDDA